MLQLGQECGRHCTVHSPVIRRQSDLDHRARSESGAVPGWLHLAPPHGQDRNLWRVDDGCKVIDRIHAQVRNCEGRTDNLVWRKLTGPGLAGKFTDLACQSCVGPIAQRRARPVQSDRRQAPRQCPDPLDGARSAGVGRLLGVARHSDRGCAVRATATALAIRTVGVSRAPSASTTRPQLRYAVRRPPTCLRVSTGRYAEWSANSG